MTHPPPAKPESERATPEPRPVGQREDEGTNETRHTPDPSADRFPATEHGRRPRGPYPHGND